MSFKETGDIVVLLGQNSEEESACPKLDLGLEKSVQKTCLEAIKTGIIKSAHDTSEGGLAVALSECCIEGSIGAVVTLDDTPHLNVGCNINNLSLLFDETQSRIIVTISPENIFSLSDIASLNKTPISIIGKISGKKLVISKGSLKLINLPVLKLQDAYKNAIPKIMGA
jgi:phosphoribosylformylglycinamidine synthase